jgi:plasmid maintenance system antidote protein VapI
MISPAAMLAKALEPMSLDLRCEIAQAAGVGRHAVQRAAGGRPISADDFLRICAVIGHDPVTGYGREPIDNPGSFDRRHLALAVRMTLYVRKHTFREAAKELGISATVVHRLKEGEEAVSIESLLAGCRYVGVHPFHYFKPACFTKTCEETSSDQEVAA